MKIKRYIGDNEISSEIIPEIKNIDNVIGETIIKVRRRMSMMCNKETTQTKKNDSANQSSVHGNPNKL